MCVGGVEIEQENCASILGKLNGTLFKISYPIQKTDIDQKIETQFKAPAE